MVSYPVNLIKYVSEETLARAGFRDSIEGHYNFLFKIDDKGIYIYIGNFFDWYKGKDFNIVVMGVLSGGKIDLNYYLGVYHGKKFEGNKRSVRKKIRDFIKNNENGVRLSALEKRINHELRKVYYNVTPTP